MFCETRAVNAAERSELVAIIFSFEHIFTIPCVPPDEVLLIPSSNFLGSLANWFVTIQSMVRVVSLRARRGDHDSAMDKKAVSTLSTSQGFQQHST